MNEHLTVRLLDFLHRVELSRCCGGIGERAPCMFDNEAAELTEELSKELMEPSVRCPMCYGALNRVEPCGYCGGVGYVPESSVTIMPLQPGPDA